MLHVAFTVNMTYYFAHPKRGSEAMDDMGILPNYNGVMVHDFRKSYYKYLCDHGFCGAHLLRELMSISENYEQEWSGQMEDLLLVIKRCVDKTRKISGSLMLRQIKDFETMYDYIIKMGLKKILRIWIWIQNQRSVVERNRHMVRRTVARTMKNY